ncbi:MAG TPA: helical backbone metal receptor [Vicinamibacterales bacterium]|jgi:iron complex transport system substrate-binding protein
MAARQKKLIAVVVALWASCAWPASGQTARRIVSLVPNVTEMLFAVGAGPQVVGVSSYDEFPPETKALPRVGALLDPDTERILSLRPDLVILYGSQTELESQFARAGIRVYAYRHSGIDNVLQTIREVARLAGRTADGDRVVRDLQAQLDAVRARVRGRPRPRTMVVIGRDTGALRGVYVSGGVGFLHELLDVAGGDDLFGDITRESVQPSNEMMIVRAPEVILELHPGDQPSAATVERERAVWNRLASVPAVRNNRVHLLYGDYLLSAGPRLGRVAETLARVLHPDR